MDPGEARLLLKKWMDEKQALLCVGSFNECLLVTEAKVFSVSDESFVLRSLRADSTMTFMIGADDITFDYAEPREFAMEELAPELAQLSSIGITFPARRSFGQRSGTSERESLVMIEMADAGKSARR